jgi:hypothetical protein
MTTIIRQNKDWLQDIIAGSIEDLLEEQKERIVDAVTKAVVGQVFAAGCISQARIDTNQCGKLVIEIDLPDPMTCEDFINEDYTNGYELMERFYSQ